jgi:hypothetical protein
MLHGHLYGGRLRMNLFQKSLRRVKLSGERIPVFLVSCGRRWLEMREKVFLIIYLKNQSQDIHPIQNTYPREGEGTIC